MHNPAKVVFAAVVMAVLALGGLDDSAVGEDTTSDVWAPLRFLVGDWEGNAQGQSGTGKVRRRYAFVLADRYLYETNVSTYPPQAANEAGEVHEHWSFFSHDRGRKALVLRQFHQEGFVNQYVLSAEESGPTKLVFVSEHFENFDNSWKARETYEILSADEFVETFELGAPGQALEMYSRNHFKRLTGPSAANVLDDAILATMAEARRAVDELGVTEPAMQRIQTALRQLARTAGLKERGDLRDLHGGGAASAVLASEGDQGLTLILARFQPGKTTPIHDHGSWAVAYVLEGQERYVQWERVDDGADPQRAQLREKYERILSPGDAVHWSEPPHDIHSQQALDDVAWELLLFGKNPLASTLHYFDPTSGQVTEMKPVTDAGAGNEDE